MPFYHIDHAYQIPFDPNSKINKDTPPLRRALNRARADGNNSEITVPIYDPDEKVVGFINCSIREWARLLRL